MWFDPHKALAALEARQEPDSERPLGATRATRATPTPEARPDVAQVARVARPGGAETQTSATGPLAHVAQVARVARPGAEVWRDARDAFEERAAIKEFEAGQPRAQAEAEALAETAASYGLDPLELLAQIERGPMNRNGKAVAAHG